MDEYDKALLVFKTKSKFKLLVLRRGIISAIGCDGLVHAGGFLSLAWPGQLG